MLLILCICTLLFATRPTSPSKSFIDWSAGQQAEQKLYWLVRRSAGFLFKWSVRTCARKHVSGLVATQRSRHAAARMKRGSFFIRQREREAGHVVGMKREPSILPARTTETNSVQFEGRETDSLSALGRNTADIHCHWGWGGVGVGVGWGLQKKDCCTELQADGSWPCTRRGGSNRQVHDPQRPSAHEGLA